MKKRHYKDFASWWNEGGWRFIVDKWSPPTFKFLRWNLPIRSPEYVVEM